MRLISKVFILGELGDLLTTFIGIRYLGLVEGNPAVVALGWWAAIPLKILIAIALVWLFERRYHVLWWYFPAVSWYAVAWNIWVTSMV